MRKIIIIVFLIILIGCDHIPRSEICSDWRDITYVTRGSSGHHIITRRMCVIKEEKAERPTEPDEMKARYGEDK